MGIKRITIVTTVIVVVFNHLCFASTQNDSTQVASLLSLAKDALRDQQTESAINYANQAAELAREYAFIEFEAESSFLLARASKQKKLTGSALKHYLHSKKLYEQLPISFTLGKLYNEMGALYENWGLHKKAQEYYLKSFPIFSEYSTKKELNLLIRKISDTYYNIGYYENSLTFYQKLADDFSSNNNYDGMLEVLKIMSNVGKEIRDYERAVGYQLQILGLTQLEDDTLGMMNAFHELATIYKEDNKYNKALEYFQRYLNLTAPTSTPENEKRMIYQYIEAMTAQGLIYEEWGEKEEDQEYLNNALAYYGVVLNVLEGSLSPDGEQFHKRMGQTYLHVARTYQLLEDYRNAVFYCHKSLENMRASKDLNVLVETYEVLVYSLRSMKKFRSALRYYDKLMQTQDSLAEQELNQRKDKIISQSIENQRQFIINKTEQDIIDQELDSLTIRQLELAAESREHQVELLMTDRELQSFAIANEQLQKDKAMQDLLLAQQQLSGEKKEKQILQLEQKQIVQSMQLKQQEFEQQEKERTIQLLELDKEIKGLELDKAASEKSYYRNGIILVSIILVLIFANLILSRRANRKLAFQNAKIEQQSENLKKANLSIQNQNNLIAEKNKELTQLNKEKNHIIGIIAHDLRNPLAVSMSLIDFVNMKSSSLNEEQKEGLDIIGRSMHRMNDMITKILDVRAIESNKLNVKLEPIYISTFTENIVSEFKDLAADKQIKLVHKSFPEGVRVEADEQYLIQVLENLLSNAIKFSPLNSKIEVLMKEKGDYMQIGIKDNGPGLKAEDHQKLFGKFQKLSAKPTAGEQSTGLGLSIVKKYVNLMGGNVWCESEQGNGATFWVELPTEQLVEA